MSQLAHIARPRIVLQRLFCIGGQAQGVYTQTALIVFKEIAGYRQDIFACSD